MHFPYCIVEMKLRLETPPAWLQSMVSSGTAITCCTPTSAIQLVQAYQVRKAVAVIVTAAWPLSNYVFAEVRFELGLSVRWPCLFILHACCPP